MSTYQFIDFIQNYVGIEIYEAFSSLGIGIREKQNETRKSV